ncbi:MAG: amino acid permease [Muribaculaceae bacterium]|nr:amino acid permease [Muribaculaceae bacterium]
MATKEETSRLGLLGLIAIVFSSMVGGGIFNIAQNIASTAGIGAVVIAWLITGFGMVFLVLTFKILSDHYPHLNQGLYQYARKGFGNYVGFNIAWGYWLCVAFGNVAFVVMLNDAVGAFFPIFLQHKWESIVFCECIVWIMFGIVERGIMTASFINTIMTFLKFAAIFIIIVILIVYFRLELLFSDVWGETIVEGERPLGGLWTQVMGTMFITMFCFVGIEGGLMLSSYAKNNKDVGKASIIGFYLALIIYALISLLCYGVRSRAELASLPDPSMAYVLRLCCGDWAYYFVISTVILSILSAFISWTLLCCQAPYGAAKSKIFPSNFLKTNKHEVPVYGLLLTTIFMSGFIVLVCTAPDVYMAGLNLTTIMVLPAYGISGGFLFKANLRKRHFHTSEERKEIIKYRIIGIFCVLYCIWCVISGGFLLFIASSILYLLGFYFYYLTYKQKVDHTVEKTVLLNLKEKILFGIIVSTSILSIVLISVGKISLS